MKARSLLGSALLLIGSLALAVETPQAKKSEYKLDKVYQLWDAGQKPDALKMVSHWKSADKKSADPWVASARFAFEQKKYKKCLSFAETALEKSPQSAAAYYWRGRSYEALSNWLDSANEYRAALLTDPNFPQASESLARVNSQLGAPEAKP